MHVLRIVISVSSLVTAAFSSPLQDRATRLTSIVSPAPNTVINPRESFSFQYSLVNWCEAGYTPLSLWLLQDQPTSASLNSSEEYIDYIYYFGTWLFNNFGAHSLLRAYRDVNETYADGKERSSTYEQPTSTTFVFGDAYFGPDMAWANSLLHRHTDRKFMPGMPSFIRCAAPRRYSAPSCSRMVTTIMALHRTAYNMVRPETVRSTSQT